MEENLNFNWKITGHKRIIQMLEKSIKNNKIAHAYLFLGQENLGKMALAKQFVKIAQCGLKKSEKKINKIPCGKCRSCQDIEKNIHPDILIIKPEAQDKKKASKKTSIGIEQIRLLQRQLSFYPHSAPYKIAIINNADKMTQEAANALLKTLEEPSGKAILILIASFAGNLPKTIISRCQQIKFFPVAKAEIKKALLNLKVDSEKIDKIARVSMGKPGIAFDLANDSEKFENRFSEINELKNLISASLIDRWKYIEKISKDNLKAKEILDLWIFWFRGLLLDFLNGKDTDKFSEDYKKYSAKYKITKIKDIIKEINKTKSLIANTNVNSRLALEVLVMEL